MEEKNEPPDNNAKLGNSSINKVNSKENINEIDLTKRPYDDNSSDDSLVNKAKRKPLDESASHADILENYSMLMNEQAKKIEELYKIIKDMREKESQYITTINQITASSSLPSIPLIPNNAQSTNTAANSMSHSTDRTKQINTTKGLKCTLQKMNTQASTSANEHRALNSTGILNPINTTNDDEVVQMQVDNHSNNQLPKTTQESKTVNSNIKKSADSNLTLIQNFRKNNNTLVI